MPAQATAFHLDAQERRKIEKRRRQEKDVRLHKRLSALLWLDDGRSIEEVAALLDVHPRSLHNWMKLYKKKGSMVSHP